MSYTMKGKKTFTKAEADAIRKLINLKVQSPSDKQKRIRDDIREIGFIIPDFSGKKKGIL